MRAQYPNIYFIVFIVTFLTLQACSSEQNKPIEATYKEWPTIAPEMTPAQKTQNTISAAQERTTKSIDSIKIVTDTSVVKAKDSVMSSAISSKTKDPSQKDTIKLKTVKASDSNRAKSNSLKPKTTKDSIKKH